MAMLMRSRSWLYLGAFVLIATALFSVVRVLNGPEVTYTTEAVTRGDVQEIVSVSGAIESDNTAELAFPVTGTVESVNVKAGDKVVPGDTLATLERNALLADRNEAVGSLAIARADKTELITGPQTEARDITNTTLESSEQNLIRVTREEQEKVDNARRKLYSDNLEAFPLNKSIATDPPAVTGTYACTDSGIYTLEMFASNAQSNYSYKLKGLENTVQSAYTSAPSALGTCGLFIQFVEDGRFGNTDWEIPVPNKNGASYISNLNTYNLAVEQRNNAIAKAEEALKLARQEQTLENAAPRSEALDRANARILQAQARISAIDASLANRVIVAPFAGTITDVHVLPGETASGQVVVNLLSEDSFDLTARIPEIDIAKLAVGKKASVVFDAQSDVVLDAEIAFISPVANEIDGVAYFEAKLHLLEEPSWLRSGLNADVDIIITKKESVLRLPKRFITSIDGNHSVLRRDNETVFAQEVTVEFIGNDGYVEVSGLKEGDVVLAP